MLDKDSWLRLIRGLIAATVDGSLRWEESGTPSGNGFTISFAGVGAGASARLGRGRTFAVSTKGASYELSAANALGQAPHELSVWGREGRKLVALGTLRSSASIGVSNSYELNALLQELYNSVEATIKSSAEIVDRLLDDLGQTD